MARHYTPKEVEQRYVERMGKELGETFYELYNEIATLYGKWNEFVILFGHSEERVKFLNKTAPGFFHMVQDTMWENILLHIARLTDPVKVGRGRETLTLQRLPLLADAAIRDKVQERFLFVDGIIGFVRDSRHRHIAHRELAVALEREGSRAIDLGSRQRVRESLQAMVDVMGVVETHYMGSAPAHYDLMSQLGNAEVLLELLERGLKAREEEWASTE